MKEENQEKIEELYTLVLNSAQSVQPKHALFNWKCPKCNSKLRKESIKERIFASEGGNEFANKVVSDAGLSPGIYDMFIEHFSCKCGYEFAKANVVAPSFDG